MHAPPVRLLAELGAARHRSESFHDAWAPALTVALAGVDGLERDQWAEALQGTVDAWQACWDRQPATRRERALAAVRDPDAEPIHDGPTCARCDEPLLGRTRRAVYCSHACQRAANGRNHALAA